MSGGRIGLLEGQLVEAKSETKILHDRLAVLEGVAAGRGGAAIGPNPHDPAMKQVAFIGFPESTPVQERIDARVAFMRQFFPDMQIKHADMGVGKNGKHTRNGFV